MIWSTNSRGDILYIANWQSGQIEWESDYRDGPFVGPVCGDLDGDKKDEVVVVSNETDSDLSSGRILVFKSDGQLRAISEPVINDWPWEDIRDIKLFDVDRDGKMEIIVAGRNKSVGVIKIYDFNSNNTFNLNWTVISEQLPNGDKIDFRSVVAADIDGNGRVEILGSSGYLIYAYDYTTGNEVWRSMQLDSSKPISTIEVGDVDKDGDLEIISISSYHDGNICIFNGRTKVLDTIISGSYTALTLINTNQSTPSIALGDNKGVIKILSYSGGKYQTSFKKDYSMNPIDGISRLSTSNELIFGTGGALKVADSSGITWTSANYGEGYGKWAVIPAGTSKIFSAGSYSVNAFDFSLEPNLSISTPNGGETWTVGTSQSILWNSNRAVSDSLIIEYSTDKGGSWTTIRSSATNNGSYLWTIPDTISDQCLVSHQASIDG